MRSRTEKLDATFVVDETKLKMAKTVIRLARKFEKALGRKLDVTGAIGELLICWHLRSKLGLRLVVNPRREGYDAIDKKGRKVEIKARRSESKELPPNSGTTSKFSKHPFAYALLGILNREYGLHGVWRAEYRDLKPLFRAKRNDVILKKFKGAGEQIYP